MRYQLLMVSRAGAAKQSRPCILFRGDWLSETGFVQGALVQALPEPDGMVFNLCNENIKSYSELFNETRKAGGNLLQVYRAEEKSYKGLTFLTTGKYILTGGLAVGDALIAKCGYDRIRVRKIDPKKLGFENVKIVPLTSIKASRTKLPVLKVRLHGQWLADAGFIIHSLVTAHAEQGSITFRLRNEGMDKYSDVVKYARANKMKIAQVVSENDLPTIGVTGSLVKSVGFDFHEMVAASYEHGIIKLQKLDFERLGF